MIQELKLFSLNDSLESVPFPNPEEQVVVRNYEFNSKRMGDTPRISATVKHSLIPEESWRNRVFVEFKGEKYFVVKTPSETKDNNDLRYKYSLEFLSERDVFNHIYFFDVLTGKSDSAFASGRWDGALFFWFQDKWKGSDAKLINSFVDIPVTNSTKVQFFGDVRQFVERINNFLKYSALGYRITIDSEVTLEEKLVSFEDKHLSDAIQEIYNLFKVPYYFEGRHIHVGREDRNEIGKVFSYGKGNGLVSVSKNNANYQLVTKITGTGSEDNIPYYYPNMSPKGKLTVEALPTNTGLKTSDIAIADPELFATEMTTTHEVRLVSNAATIRSTEYKIRREFKPYDAKNVVYGGYDRMTFKLNVSIPHDGALKFRLFIKDVTGPTSGDVFNMDTIQSVVCYDNNEQRVSSFAKVSDDEIVIHGVKASEYAYIEIAFKYPGNGKSTNLHFVAYPKPYNVWTRDGEEISLSSIGIKVSSSAKVSDGDGFIQQVGEYILPSKRLMPSIYRASKGENRFYEAKNNTYDKKSGEKYEFTNEYNPHAPKEAVVKFPDIKPSIEGILNNGLRIDMFSEFAYDENDSSDFDAKTKQYKHPYFFGKLRPLGFNLFDASNEKRAMSISMKSGSCGACEFQIGVGKNSGINTVQVNKDGSLKRFTEGEHAGDVICGREGTPAARPQTGENGEPNQNDTTSNAVWIALKKDDSTYDNMELMPNSALKPKSVMNAGESGADTFVILGMTMPQYLVEAAEKRLDDELIRYMFENNNEKFNFDIKLSRIYLAENEDLMESIDENSMISIEHHGNIYRMHVDSYKFKVKDSEILPEIELSVKDTISVHKGQMDAKMGEIKGEILSTINISDFVKAVLPLFLKKDAEDSTKSPVHLLGGVEIGANKNTSVNVDKEGNVKANSVESRDFTQGGLGSGYSLSTDANTGRSRLEIDELFVRAKAYFSVLQIMSLKYAGGNWVFSPAGEECTLVEYHEYKKGVTTEPFYRCFFNKKSKEENGIGRNYFEVGDLVQFKDFNAKEGVSQNVSSRYYWRKCINKGEDFIDLSDSTSGKDPSVSNDAPQIGDSMVVFGSKAPDRGNVILIETVGPNAPSIRQYQDIHDFSLVGKETTRISPNGNNFEGSFTITNTPSGVPQDVTEFIGEQQSEMNKNIGQLAERLDNIEKQNDGAIEFWFGKERPSDDREPTKTWIAEGSQENHLADMYYAEDDTAWRYTKSDNGTYYWKEVVDSGAKEALEAAQNAQATADGKMKVFIQDEAHPTPEPPYAVGDLWANATYPISKTRTAIKYYDDLLRCVTPAKKGETFNIEHWTKATKYTDDTAAEEAKKRMDSWAADGVISPAEKQSLKDERKRIDADLSQITNAYEKFGLTYPLEYNNAHISYANILGSLTVPGDEAIPIPSQFESIQEDYYRQRTICFGKIDDASKKYAEDMADNITVGGTNIVRNSKFVEVEYIPDSNYNYATRTLARKLKSNTEYTISVGCSEIVAGTFDHFTLLLYDANKYGELYRLEIPVSQERQVRHFSLSNVPNVDFSLLVYAGVAGSTLGNAIKVKEIKLEEGNKVTDWSPAPEDIQSQFEVTNSRITSEINGVKEDYNGKFTETSTSIKQTNESITTEVKKREELEGTVTSQGSRITATEDSITQKVWKEDINELEGRVKESYATISQTEKDINIAVGSIEVGGNNLLDGTKSTYEDMSEQYNLIGYIEKPEGDYVARVFIDNPSSSGSAYVHVEGDITGWNENYDYFNGESISSLSGKGYSTVVIPDCSKYIRLRCFVGNYSGGKISFKEYKLEKGNKPTAWTPSIADERKNAKKGNLIENSQKVVIEALPSDYNYTSFVPVIRFKKNTEYTISIGSSSGNVSEYTVCFYDFQNVSQSIFHVFNVSAERQIKTIKTGDIDPASTKFLIYAGINGLTSGKSITCEEVQVEEGNIATEWSPCIKNVETRSLKNEASLVVTQEGIEANAKKIETVDGKVQTHEATLNVHAEQIEARVTNAQMESAITQSADNIKLHVKETNPHVNLLPSDASFWENNTLLEGKPVGSTYEQTKFYSTSRIALKSLLYIGSGIPYIYADTSFTEYELSVLQFDIHKKFLGRTAGNDWSSGNAIPVSSDCVYLGVTMRHLDLDMAPSEAIDAFAKIEIGEEPTPYTPCPTQNTKKQLLDTGIDIDSHDVTVTADKFLVRDREGYPIGVFTHNENGKPVVKAENIEADKIVSTQVYSIGADGTRTEISGGIIQIFGNQSNNPNIKIGSNAAGEAIFKFYDKDGKETLNLSPKEGLVKLSTPYMDAVYVGWVYSNVPNPSPEIVIQNVQRLSKTLYYQYQSGTIGGDDSLNGRYYQSKAMSGGKPSGSYIPSGWYSDNFGEPYLLYVSSFGMTDIYPPLARPGKTYKMKNIFLIQNGRRGPMRRVFWE